MIKLCSIDSQMFYTESSGHKTHYKRKENYHIDETVDRISIYDEKDKPIISSVLFSDIVDCNDVAMASMQAAIDYIKLVINEFPSVSAGGQSPDSLVVERLKNGGNDNLNVDGSVTPVSFIYQNNDNDVLLNGLKLFTRDSPGNYTNDKFAAIPELTNGLKISIAGQEFFNFKTNRDIGIAMDEATTTFLSNQDKNVKANKSLGGALLKKGEIVEALVRDDLTAIDQIVVSIEGIAI